MLERCPEESGLPESESAGEKRGGEEPATMSHSASEALRSSLDKRLTSWRVSELLFL